jgi:TolB protein
MDSRLLRPQWPRRRFTAALGAALGTSVVGVLPREARAQVQIEIRGVGAVTLPLAVAPLRGESAGAAVGAAPGPGALSAIIRADLERSGAFRFVEPPAQMDERSPVPQPELRARGADALLSGSVTRLADGTYDIRYRLWDAIRGEPHFAKAIVAQPGDLRLAAHRIADDVYEKLTGERGVFATRIAYVTRAGRQYALRITDADGEAGQVAVQSAEPLISPAWSPDGRSLAYVSFETQKAGVWVQEVATGKRSLVAHFRGSNSAPAWSPSGRELAVALSRDGLTQLFLMGADGSNPRRLTTSSAIDTEPAFTPDGQTVYFVSDRGGGPQIYRMPVSGSGRAERVTFRGSYNISPAISPDGSTLAYVAREGNAFRVTTMELASGTLRTISDTNDDESPSFAPNGRLLVYASRAQGRDVLMTTTLDGRVRTRLLTSGLDMREPAWGPYGR